MIRKRLIEDPVVFFNLNLFNWLVCQCDIDSSKAGWKCHFRIEIVRYHSIKHITVYSIFSNK